MAFFCFPNHVLKLIWSTAKCRQIKFCNTWYYIVVFVTLLVCFSSKFQATNVFPKHILKSKLPDNLIQARNKCFCHLIVNSFLCNIFCKFLIKFFSPGLWNTGFVSSGASLTSWREGVSLALVGHPSADGVTIKTPYGVDILHQPASYPIFPIGLVKTESDFFVRSVETGLGRWMVGSCD